MKLPINNKVYFDSITHSYVRESDGKYLSGVTGLMRKHGLSTDYLGIPEHILKNAAERGTAVHKAVQDTINGLDYTDSIDFTSPHYNFVKTAMTEYSNLNLNAIASEFLISDNEMVASSIDIVLSDYSLVDIKTSASLDIEPLRWQLSIYRYLFELQTGFKVPKMWGLHLRDKAQMVEIQPIEKSEIERLFECERGGTIYQPQQNKGELELINSDDLHNALVIERKIVEMEQNVKLLKEQREKFISGMYDLMEQYDIKQIDNEAYKITRVLPTTRKSFDSARFKADNPELYSEYIKESPVKGSLRITLKN